MKILLISDIHSNFQALEAVWQREKDCDQVWCAGDLVDYGPFPREVIDWIRQHQAICVQGNHDRAVITCFQAADALAEVPEHEHRWVQHNARKLKAAEIKFLNELPLRRTMIADQHCYCMCHQGAEKYEIINTMIEFDELWGETPAPSPDSGGERRMVLGHTHYPAVHYLSDNCAWINPGSLSYRPTRQHRDISRDADYMTITDGKIEMKRISYDRRPLFAAVQNEIIDPGQAAVALRFFAEPESRLFNHNPGSTTKGKKIKVQ